MKFLAGLLLGLAATGLNFGIMYFGVRVMFKKQDGPARFILPLTQVVRYLVFGAIIYGALRLQLGSVWGLLAGVTVGIAGFMVWQVTNNARNRRSS